MREVIVIATSASRPKYRSDFLKCLCYRSGTHVRFIYRKKWIQKGLLTTSEAELKKTPAIIVFCEPQKNDPKTFSYTPVRFASIQSIGSKTFIEQGDDNTHLYVDLLLEDFIAVTKTTIASHVNASNPTTHQSSSNIEALFEKWDTWLAHIDERPGPSTDANPEGTGYFLFSATDFDGETPSTTKLENFAWETLAVRLIMTKSLHNCLLYRFRGLYEGLPAETASLWHPIQALTQSTRALLTRKKNLFQLLKELRLWLSKRAGKTREWLSQLNKQFEQWLRDEPRNQQTQLMRLAPRDAQEAQLKEIEPKPYFASTEAYHLKSGGFYTLRLHFLAHPDSLYGPDALLPQISTDAINVSRPLSSTEGLGTDAFIIMSCNQSPKAMIATLTIKERDKEDNSKEDREVRLANVEFLVTVRPQRLTLMLIVSLVVVGAVLTGISKDFLQSIVSPTSNTYVYADAYVGLAKIGGAFVLGLGALAGFGKT